MNQSSSKLKTYIYSLWVLTALSVLLFTISMFVSFDASTGYFNNSFLSYMQKALVIVSVLFFVSIMFVIPKGTFSAEAPKNTRITMFSSLFCGVLYAAGTVMAFLAVVNNASKITPRGKYIFFGIVITGILSAIYFILDAIFSDKDFAPLKIIPAIALIINLFLSIVYHHLDLFVGINTPRKTLLFVGFVVAALFIVQELRFKVAESQPRAYVLFGSCTTLLCSVMSIPGIIAHIAGSVKDGAFLPFYLMGLVLAVYAFAKLFAYVKSND